MCTLLALLAKADDPPVTTGVLTAGAGATLPLTARRKDRSELLLANTGTGYLRVNIHHSLVAGALCVRQLGDGVHHTRVIRMHESDRIRGYQQEYLMRLRRLNPECETDTTFLLNGNEAESLR